MEVVLCRLPHGQLNQMSRQINKHDLDALEKAVLTPMEMSFSLLGEND